MPVVIPFPTDGVSRSEVSAYGAVELAHPRRIIICSFIRNPKDDVRDPVQLATIYGSTRNAQGCRSLENLGVQ